jgi:putative transposase
MRHGHMPGEVTLGGRRVPVSRPRVRTADDRAEVELESYAEFGSRDLLERVALEPTAQAALKRTLCSTNPIKSMIDTVRTAHRQALARRRHAPALDRRGHGRGATRLPARQGPPRPAPSWSPPSPRS